MSGHRHFPSGYSVRILAGGLALTFLAVAVAGLSAAGDPDAKTQAAAGGRRRPAGQDP